MRHRRTGTQGRRYQRRLCNLLWRRPCRHRFASMNLQAIWTLCRQRHRQRDQFLILLRNRPIFERCLIERPESVHRFGSSFAERFQLLQIRHVIHRYLSLCYISCYNCDSRPTVQKLLVSISGPALSTPRKIFIEEWAYSTSGSASRSPSRSNRLSNIKRRSSIQRFATESPAVSIRQVRTLPTLVVRTSPLFSRICRCCTTAATVMPSGMAKIVAETGASLSLSTIARRVGSPSAWKTRSMLTFCLGIASGLSRKDVHYRASSFASCSNSALQPVSRIFAPSEPSKKAACSV